MAANASVKIIKTMLFKGGTRQYSNRYHFNGGTPADATHWHTLFDNIVTAEKAVHSSDTTIINAIGYAAGSDVPVASKVYSTAGTLTLAGTDKFVTGEAAALTRYSTSARTVKNHPIYLYSYYHRVACNPTVSTDSLATAEKSALETYAGAWITGFSDGGGITAVRASPNGAAATGHITEEWITHRDFPYTTSV